MAMPATGRIAAAACLCALLAAFGSQAAQGQTTQGQAAQGSAADARSAAELADSIGVNTHMASPDTGPTGTSYGNVEAIVPELAFLRVKHVRDILLIGPHIHRLDTIHRRLGIKFILAYDDYTRTGNSASLRAALANVAPHREWIEGIEGPNEPDQFGLHFNGQSGAPAVMALQRELYRLVKNDPKLKDVPVYCTALSYPAPGGLADRIGNLASACDIAPAHVYVENRSLGAHLPFEYIARWANYPAAFVPGRPRIITEGGWLTAPDHADGVDEATQAKYTLVYLLDAFSQGIARTYLYDLSDSGSEQYGLFRADGTPKPAARMLARLQALLSDPARPGANPGSGGPSGLSYTVTGLPGSGHHLLLRKPDGTFLLALWQEAFLWDRATHAPSPVPPVTVSVHLDGEPRETDVIDILSDGKGDAPGAAKRQDVPVTLPDHPVFLSIR